MCQALPNGTIVVNTWGFDQTNVDFYQVISATKHFVTLRELKSKTVEDSPLAMAGHSTPEIDGEDRFQSAETSKHKVTPDQGNPRATWLESVSINFKYGSGRVWNGTPQRCSWYA